MSVRLCHHRKEDGALCRAIALRGRIYCYFHSEFHPRRLRRMWLLRRRLQ